MTTPERTTEELLSYRHHDFTDPMSELNKLEMIYASVLLKRPGADLACRHCDVELRPLPMYGTAWGLEHFHEAGCPEVDEWAGEGRSRL